MGKKDKKRLARQAAQRAIALNRRARHDYHILETLEVGLVLCGTEVKALREYRVNLKEAYGVIQNGELFLADCHIGEYSHGNRYNHDPLRKRKLLAHRAEIKRLIGKVSQRGLTLIPLKLYFKKGKAKLELALAQGKRLYDKREAKRRKIARWEISESLR